MKSVRILDTDIDVVARDALARLFEEALDGAARLFMVTANPEILLRAHEDTGYRAVLARASHRIADGVGIVLAARLLGASVTRLPGRMALDALLAAADARGASVHVALREGGLTLPDRAARELRRRFPRIRLTVRAYPPEDVPDRSDARVVVAAFGAPDQERWLDAHRSAFPDARVRIGVGGAIDVLCGTLPAPPRAMARSGLEWLWRLVIQPKRFPRIFRAIFVFPVTALLHRPHES